MSVFGNLVLTAALLALSGCGRDSAPPSATGRDVAQVAAFEAVPVDALQARAESALRERRYYAPVGDSAIDYYLALRDRRPGDPGVAAALTELQPYLLIAGEQALATGDLSQAQRLLGLLARVDTDAPALPRLRDGLRLAELAQQASSSAVADADIAAIEAARRADDVLAAPTKALVAQAVTAVVAASPVAAASTPAPVPVPVPRLAVAEPAAVARADIVPRIVVPTLPAPAPAPSAPRLLRDAAPRYPLGALNRRIEGSVQVAFRIEPDGSVAGLRLVSATPAGLFEEAALAAVARWRFEATGRRVDMQRTLSFRLPKG